MCSVSELTVTANVITYNEINFPFIPAATAPILTEGIGDISVTYDSLGNTVVRSARLIDGIGPLIGSAQIAERFFPVRIH